MFVIGRSGERELHFVFAPDDFALEHLLDLVNDLLPYPRLVDLSEEMREHQGFYPRRASR
jgi:hypothetical protein